MPKTGGTRQGAGRPPKPAATKILDGNPGKRPIAVLEFYKDKPVSKKFKKKVPSYLDQAAKEGDAILPSTTELYEDIRGFVEAAGCLDKISDQLLQEYAYLRRSFLECENFNKVHGRIANGRRSPYVTMALDYQKAAQYVFNSIWNLIIRCSTEVYAADRNSFLQKMETRGF